jgi:GT2 family glycosyltransferase
VGIVGAQAVDDAGRIHRSCARFPTPRSFIAHSCGLTALWPRAFPDHFMREWPHDADREVDHVIGAYYLVRRELWQQLDGMDERFFVYLEDLDFSLRARQRGWRAWFLARARIYHKGGGTSEQIKARRLFYSLRSRLLYAGKHFTALGFAAVAAATLLIEPFTRCLLCVLRREWAGLAQTSQAYWSLYAEAGGILRRARSAR